MYSKRIRNRFHQTLSILWAAFATADAVTEAARRQRGAGEEAPDDATPVSVIGEIFVLFGRSLIDELRHLLAADARYQELRLRQRRRQTRRDGVTQRLYRKVVDARKMFKGIFGYEGACEYFGLKGATEREPKALHLQASEAVHWARTQDQTPTPVIAGAEGEAEKAVDQVGDLCRDLRDALDAVGLGRAETDAAMIDQRQAMKSFDRIALETAHYLEAQLNLWGLPTLSAAVRPGVGRRGRPLKEQPVDLHPDLVEPALARDLSSLDVAELKLLLNDFEGLLANADDVGNGSARDVASSSGVRNGSEASPAVSKADGNRSEALEKIESPLPEPSADPEIIEPALPESSGSEEIIESSLPERSARVDQTTSPLPERSAGDEKSARALPESEKSRASDLFSRLNVPPPAAPCVPRSYRRDIAQRPRAAAGRRSSSGATEDSKLRRIREAASAWWVRMRRAA